MLSIKSLVVDRWKSSPSWPQAWHHGPCRGVAQLAQGVPGGKACSPPGLRRRKPPRDPAAAVSSS